MTVTAWPIRATVAQTISLREEAAQLLPDIADAKAIDAERARSIARNVIMRDEIVEMAVAVVEAKEAFVLRRVTELAAALLRMGQCTKVSVRRD